MGHTEWIFAVVAVGLTILGLWVKIHLKFKENKLALDREKQQRKDTELKLLKIQEEQDKARAVEITKHQVVQELADNKKDEQQQDDESHYRESLNKELTTNRIAIRGYFTEEKTDLSKTFIPLHISHEHGQLPELPKIDHSDSNARTMEILKIAFKKESLILISGHPGYGKTTLMKYLGLHCLENKADKLGLNPHTLPLWLPLQELKFSEDNQLSPLAECLALRSCNKQGKDLSKQVFQNWLTERQQGVLVLLDGFDEIRDSKKREIICHWLKDIMTVCHHAKFILSSRPMALEHCKHLIENYVHTRIYAFNKPQREQFLRKWYSQISISKLTQEPQANSIIIKQQEKETKIKVDKLIEKLDLEKHEHISRLVRTPLLLQIVAVLYDKNQLKLSNRGELYDAILHYVLIQRDDERKLNDEQLIEGTELKKADIYDLLTDLACYMQTEGENKQEISETFLSQRIGEYYSEKPQPQPKQQQVINYFRHRSDVLVRQGDYLTELDGLNINKNAFYIFRHNSYREYFVGLWLKENFHKPEIKKLLWKHFLDDWWEEPLRFLMNLLSAEQINEYWKWIFAKNKIYADELIGAEGKQLGKFVLDLVRETENRPVKELKKRLTNRNLKDVKKKQFVINCLGRLEIPKAYEVIYEFCVDCEDDTLVASGVDILSKYSPEFFEKLIEQLGDTRYQGKAIKQTIDGNNESNICFKRVNSEIEYNAEYIFIDKPSEDMIKVNSELCDVGSFYMAKTPVTNRQYRRFVRYLEGKEKELLAKLSLELFQQTLLSFSRDEEHHQDKNFTNYIKESDKWNELFVSGYDAEKEFNGDDQPVVAISWYAARAYCFWLSCLDNHQELKQGEISVRLLADTFRLPHEKEWLWAASKPNEGTGLREYPWGKEEPDHKRANYTGKLGRTSAVDEYFEGASIDGLLGMAGNVWEWQDGWYDSDQDSRALRGGSWGVQAEDLRCSARNNWDPDLSSLDVGFRCLRSQKTDTLII